MKRIILLSAVLAIVLYGCMATEADVDKISIGMSKAEVRQIIGAPRLAKEGVWIYHNIGTLDSLHVIFRDEKGEETDYVTDTERFYRDAQMIGEPR